MSIELWVLINALFRIAPYDPSQSLPSSTTLEHIGQVSSFNLKGMSSVPESQELLHEACTHNFYLAGRYNTQRKI